MNNTTDFLEDDEEEWANEPPIEDDFNAVNAPKAPPIVIPAIKPSQFTEFAFRMPRADGLGYDPFSFEGRRHMVRCYDTPAKRLLLCCGRQVEKSCGETSHILMQDGSVKKARDIEVGDVVATMGLDGSRMGTGEVSWKSSIYSKPVVRIKTRQGHNCEVATTHPMRLWGKWVEAGELRVGDRLAVVRRAGEFIGRHQPRERITLTAYLLGDGYITHKGLSLTSLPGPKLDEYIRNVVSLGGGVSVARRNGTLAVEARAMRVPKLREWLQEDGLIGMKSATKFLPSWVFSLSRQDTALFVNRLWSTDGHVKQNTPGKYSIEYCSISLLMIRQLQQLLWKFGIPSNIRENWPNIYKKRNEKKLAYILRIETQNGVRVFLSEIGAIGKTECVAAPTVQENNNRDTYPIEINELLRNIISSRPDGRRGRTPLWSLRKAGLRETLKYPPTQHKLIEYYNFFTGAGGFDDRLLEELYNAITTDLYWDEIESIEHLGEQPCVDFEVEGTHNFVCDGFITHNSTLLGNVLLCYLCMVNSYKALYVSPSATQTKVFSVDRIKEPIETSDVLKSFTTGMLSQNVFEKQFVNRSKVTLRYAFLNADRARGIPAWALALDEIQDILFDNIPVIEQCTSHAPEERKRFIYAGTPKSLDNTIEYYRANLSTQGEWVVPCDRHGGETGRYWNILGEKNIGRKGLSCEKCGELITPQHPDSQWAFMTKYDERRTPFESYRIPQLMVPWTVWNDVLLNYERYPRDKFYNEVLGISYDSGMRPLTAAQLMEHCDSSYVMDQKHLKEYQRKSLAQPVYMGIDWGSGTSAYTVVTLGTYEGLKFRVFYMHRFVGEDIDPLVQIEKICEIINEFNVKVVGADWGFGFASNDMLVRRFGRNRVYKFHYMARCRKKVEWDSTLMRFKVHRTEVMSDVFNAIKRGHFIFPRWDTFKIPYAQDMLNIYSDYNETLRMVQYDHSPDKPDDTFHALTYCLLASMLVQPRPDIIAPNREDPATGPVISSYTGPVDQG